MESRPRSEPLWSLPVTPEAVAWAYRYLLGREPESPEIVARMLSLPSCEDLRETILSSTEFQSLVMRLGAGSSNAIVRFCLSDGLYLYLNLRDRFVSFVCLKEAYEPSETSYVLEQLRPGDGFIDVGANIGWYTVKAAAKVGNRGRVFAFEPNHNSFHLLSKSVRDNEQTNVELHNVGLWDRMSVLSLASEIDGANPGHACIQPQSSAAAANGMQIESIPVVALDDVELGVKIRLIKMDIEGAEYRALLGALRTLEEHRPIILSEVFDEQLRLVSGVDACEYVTFLGSLGYQASAFVDGALTMVHDVEQHLAARPISNMVFLPR